MRAARFLTGNPPCPERVAIEARETPQTDESFAALVQGADIIYFPIELLGPGSRTEPATRLVDALQRTGSAFTIGLDLIAGDEQALLDQWAKRELSTEKLTTHLHLSGTPRERENCRAFLGQAERLDVRFLALRGPAMSRPRRSPRLRGAPRGGIRGRADHRTFSQAPRQEAARSYPPAPSRERPGRAVFRRAENQGASVGARCEARPVVAFPTTGLERSA